MNSRVKNVKYYSNYYDDWMDIEAVWKTEYTPISVLKYPREITVKYEYEDGTNSISPIG